MALPTISDREAERQLDISRQRYDVDREVIRQSEKWTKEYFENIGTPDLFNPILFDEWERIYHDEYRKRNDAIQELRRRQRGLAVNVRQSDAPWPILYGRVRVGGVISFITTDQPQGGEYLHVVFTLAGHEIESVQKIFINNEEVEFEDDISDAGANPNSWGATGSKWETIVFASVRSLGGHSVVNWDLENQGSTLFPGLIGSNHVQQGRAMVYMIFRFDNEVFASGFPLVEFEVEGNNQIYDSRTTTTGYTANAALITAHHLTNSVYGLGSDWTDTIDETDLNTQADTCDESITRSDGGTEARYEINGVLFTDQPRREQIAQLITSIGGYVTYVGGKWLIRPADWPATAGDLSLDEDDTLSGLTVNMMPGQASRFNRVSGRYVSAAQDYQLLEFPPVTNALYLSEDQGIESSLDILLPMCTSYNQAQRLAKIELERIRQGIEVRGTFSLKAYQAQVGDVIALTNADLGWSSKLFEVTYLQLQIGGQNQPAFSVSLVLKETASGVFDWVSGSETEQDLAPDSGLPDPATIYAPTSLTAASGTTYLYTNPDGTIFSRIYLSWTAPTDPFVASGGFIDIGYKLSSDSNWSDATSVPGASTFSYILDVNDGELYDCRIRSRNVLGVTSDWIVVNSHRVIGKTAAPSDVLGLSATVENYGTLISWDEISDVDRSYYIVKSGSSWSSATIIAETRSTSFRWTNQTAGNYTILVKAVDTSGNESTSAGSTGLTIRAPDVPTVAAVVVEADALISWNNVETDYAIAEYILSYGTAAGDTELARVTGTTYKTRINWSGERRFWVQGVDIATNTGTGGSRVLEVVPPSIVRSLQADVMDNNVLLKWLAPNIGTLPIAYYNVKKGQAFESAVLVGTHDGTFAVLLELLADTYHYWVTAVDQAGNEGTQIGASAIVSQPPDYELRAEDAINPHYSKRENVLSGQDSPRMVALFDSSNSEYLSRVDNSDLSIGNGQDFTIVCRFRATLDSAQQVLVSKYSTNTVAGGEYEIGIDAANKLYFKVVGGTTETTETAASALTTDTWYTVIAWYVHADQEISLQYGAVSVTTAAHTADINNSNQAFNIGRSLASGGSAYLDGQVSFVGLWKRELNATEIQKILDIDASLDFNFLDAGLLINAIAVYSLNEVSGSREDTLGVHDLMDNNTVLSAQDTTDSSRTLELNLGEIWAPVDDTRTWTQHFTDASQTTIDGFISSGYGIWLQPTTTSTAYLERIIDFGALIASAIINVSWLEVPIDSTVSIVSKISYSADGVTFSDYVTAISSFATLVRAIKIKIEISGTDDRSLSKLESIRYRLDVKKSIDDGDATVYASDYFGTPIPFNDTFLDIERIALAAEQQFRAARFQSGNSEYLSVASHADFTMASQDATLAAWVRLEETQRSQVIAAKWKASGSDDREYAMIVYNDSGTYVFAIVVSSDGTSGAYTYTTDDAFGQVPIGEWAFVAVEHDYANSKLRIKINNLPWTEDTYASDVHSSTGSFYIGANDVSSADYLHGMVRNVGKWNKCLLEEELETLYYRGLIDYTELSSTISCAEFTATNSEYLSVGDNAELSVTGDFTMCAWIRLDILAGGSDIDIMGKWANSSKGYLLYHDTTNRFHFYLSSDGSAEDGTVIASSYGDAVAGDWVFVVCRYDGTDMKIWVNRDEDTTAYSSGIFDSTASLNIGRFDGSSNYFDGLIGRVGLWERAITDEEILFLYNNKQPQGYSNLTSSIKTSMISWWELDEASGERLDSHSDNDLTDNSTVTQVSLDVSVYTDELKAWYTLDELSGARTDDKNSHTLIDNNSVLARTLDITPAYNFEDLPSPLSFYGLLYNQGTRITGPVTWSARGFANPLGEIPAAGFTALEDVNGDPIVTATSEAIVVI